MPGAAPGAFETELLYDGDPSEATPSPALPLALFNGAGTSMTLVILTPMQLLLLAVKTASGSVRLLGSCAT
jgi:hypothetical protein